MTLQEYMDPQRFPLTTQGNLSPSNQLMIDAFNMDKFKELAEEGKLITERQRAIWAEFQVKLEHHARLTRELAEAERAEREKGKGAK